MQYRNKKTGAIVEVKTILSGDWEPVEPLRIVSVPRPEKPAEEPKPKKKAPAKKKAR